ncbi:hypothetical protein MMC17_001468 [Xylographa soralifera]|nr:hypothetical protein [Xylographa soralifera]
MDLNTDHEMSDSLLDLGNNATRSASGLLDSRADFGIQDSEASDDDLGDDLEDEIHGDHTETHNSCRTVDPVLLPIGPQATIRRFKNYNYQAFNLNGRLPSEASHYVDGSGMDTEQEPTQPATQPIFDRRRGGESSFSVEDEADIICILQPVNPPACEAMAIVARVTPQHILQNNDVERKDEDDLEYDTLDDNEPKPTQDDKVSANKDIALRISSRVKDVCMGFIFGRDPTKCDIMIDLPPPYENRRVSGMHFRIFVNKEGIIMLEDTSTNGTLIDGKLLKYDTKAPNIRRMHMIAKGSTIEIFLGPIGSTIKFNVTTPNRDLGAEKYEYRLRDYLAYIAEMNFRATAGPQALAARPPLPLPFTQTNSHPNTPFQGSGAIMLTAGSTPFNCGAKWNGGEKYNVVDHIGKGAFADVFKFATKREGKVFAVKQIEKRKFMKDGVLDHKVHNELRIMKILNHPHIVEYVEYEEREKYLFIVMEYISHGDLLRYLGNYGKMYEPQCQSITRQLCHALRYLHNCRITHRDIKPDNILILSLEPFVVKLSDFGLSKVITHDETFLKTFCGTLLYCAPEIYPEYEQYKKGLTLKRVRHNEPPPKTSPYSSAVDIWSCAAVLFHLLCEQAPYKGSAEHRGALMLKNIMEVPLDVSPLHVSGVSALGITFLQQLLRVDPLERPSAAECLQHPWISRIADVVDIAANEDQAPAGLAVIQEEDEEDQLDASQLSIHDDNGSALDACSDSGEEVSDVDEIDHTRLSKRQRLDGVPVGAQLSQRAFAYPSLPVTDQIYAMNAEASPTNRLFGEIGASDLHSSGVLSNGANVALDLHYRDDRGGEGNYDQEDASEVGSELDAPVILQHPTAFPHPYYSLPVGSAPSLMGAEGLIRQLNMASPESAASAPVTPRTPRTPLSRRDSAASSSAVSGSKKASQLLRSENSEITPKRPRVLSPELPRPWIDGSGDSRMHSLGYESRVSDEDVVKEDEDRASSPTAATVDESIPLMGESPANMRTMGALNVHSPTTFLPAGNTRSGVGSASMQQDRYDIRNTSGAIVSERKNRVSAIVNDPARQATTVTTRTNAGTAGRSFNSFNNHTYVTEFARPATRLGKLVSLPGSILEVSLNLEKRHTSYGRDPESTYIYPDPMDTRIPKSALDIVFWRSGIERDLEMGAELVKMPDISALISTRCNRWIKVNDVKLSKAEGDGWLYGILKHGDVVTIFEGPSGFLKFRAEFYLGLSQVPRGTGEDFHVEKEVEKFMAVMSRRGSPASSENTAVTF